MRAGPCFVFEGNDAHSIAVSESLDMVVVSHDERLLKMLPLQAVCGGRTDCRMMPMDIAWPNPSAVQFGGNLAFLADCPLLLVTDLLTVHIVDAQRHAHVGHLHPSFKDLKDGVGVVSVAATKGIVAVSLTKGLRVFAGTNSTWTLLHDIPHEFSGSRLTFSDHRTLLVTYPLRVGIYEVDIYDGLVRKTRYRHFSQPWTCAAACSSTTVCAGYTLASLSFLDLFVNDARKQTFAWVEAPFPVYVAVAAVPPGNCVLVLLDYARRGHGNVSVFATDEVLAMAAMSPARVGWMQVVARGMVFAF